jgi:hypothetical protein
VTAPAVIEDDPFATPEDTRQAKRDKIIRGGRYRLPNRDGSHHPGGYQRTTNLIGAFSDQRALHEWDMSTTLAGLATHPALLTELQEIIVKMGEISPEAIKAARESLLELGEKAKNAAGGGRGAERGNRVHAIAEAEWRGLPYAAGDGERELIRLITVALKQAQLRPIPGMQERIVMVEHLETCGTLDTLLEDLLTQLVHMGDTKSQKKFWSYMEVEAQLAFYSRGDCMWDPERKRWVDMPYKIEQTRGAAIWVPPVPEGEPQIAQVVPLDLERGWVTVGIAKLNVEQRSVCKSARQAVSGIKNTWQATRPNLTELYARMLGSIASREDGSRLFREASELGIWGPELEQVAALRLQSL